MKKNQEEDKPLSFVKRWILAFKRILRLFDNKQISSNSEFVDKLLNDEKKNARTQEERDILLEKRSLLEELCDDVDSYYKKKASAEKAANLDDWFESEVHNFVQDTIPDATQEDVHETQEILSNSMDTDIEVRSSLLKNEFSSDELDTYEDIANKSDKDE